MESSRSNENKPIKGRENFQIYEKNKKCGMKNIVKLRLSEKSESEE